VFVDLDGVACLVVGGGRVAERRVRGLLDAGARVTVVAPDLSAGLRALADAAALSAVAEPFRPEHLDLDPAAGGPWGLVVAATSDPSVNAAVAAAGADRGLWVNDASDRTGGAVAVPAVARTGRVTLAVATGGVSPGAAAWLRDRLADAVPAEVVEALDLIAEVTAERTAAGAPPARLDWRALLDSGMLVDIREGRRAVAKERLQACLSSSSD
jgi:siroheme synthase-like protein